MGTCLYMIWTALACLIHFINSIVWSGNTTNWAPVWCDISMFIHPLSRHSILIPEELLSSAVRIEIGVAVAWPASILLITRRLYHDISATVGTTRSRSEVRCRIKFSVAKGCLTFNLFDRDVVS